MFSRDTTFPEEFDEKIRPCSITLRLESHGRWMRSSKYNWALIFDFGNRRVLYEAQNQNGILTPSWRDCTGQGIKKWKAMGRLQVSPRQIYQEARLHPLNGSRFSERQSQTWILQLLQGIETSLLYPSAGAVRDDEVAPEFQEALENVSTIWEGVAALRDLMSNSTPEPVVQPEPEGPPEPMPPLEQPMEPIAQEDEGLFSGMVSELLDFFSEL